MRRLVLHSAALAVLMLMTASAAQCLTEEESVPRYLQSIETCKARIAEDEKILREYDAEMRHVTQNDPDSVRRRTELRILKKFYNDEIEVNKAKIVDYYKRIQEIKKNVKGGQ